ncbi:uncharacterized protein LOC122502982 [Leptopilina heterotoma]|uniref:uncharacterized protein LOC122502982 n=1 Tax=Leptopilina heterotoma TaxID=63436 RepID=UPI001CA8C61C|nr:uncharacterized protein LOC122502982 [Leptopilina heterotoma]
MSDTEEKNNSPGDNDGKGEVDISVVSSGNLRIQQFWPNKIELWFRLLEAQFATSRISKDDTKFNITIANFGKKYVEQVEDIIISPPDEKKYECLKKVLIKRLSDSDSSRVRRLLENEEIGDRKPSQFFRDLKKLATTSVPEEFILTLWKNRLPTDIQRVLAASNIADVSSLIDTADRVHEIPRNAGRIAEIKKDDDFSSWKDEIRKLREEISALSLGRERNENRARNRSKSRNRSSTPGRKSEYKEDGRFCWYHFHYKEKATKWRDPCAWKSGNDQNHQ